MSPLLPPPKDPYNRPARELAGYVAATVPDGEEVPAGNAPVTPSEAISMLAGFGPVTLFQMAAASDPYSFAFKRVWYNATPYNYCRITVDVKTAGASGSKLKAYYSPSGGAGTFVSLGLAAPIEIAIDSVGVKKAGGFMVAAASADVVFALEGYGGDGVASPEFDLVTLQFDLQQRITRPPVTRYFCPAVAGSEPSAAGHDGGWVDVFGVNGAQPNGELWPTYPFKLPYLDLELDTLANMIAAGWIFTGGDFGGWTEVADDESNPAIARAGTIILACHAGSQDFAKSFALAANAKGYVIRGKTRLQGGTWTVVNFMGFPPQCAAQGGSDCGPAGTVCANPVIASPGGVAAFYGMVYDLGRPWGRSHVRTGPWGGGSQSIGGSLVGAPGYGAFLAAFAGVQVGVDEPEPPGSMCPSSGGIATLTEALTNYEEKRASGSVKRFIDAPLKAQTIEAHTYQIRFGAGIIAGSTTAPRFAVGHVHVRVSIWRESDDSIVAVLGDATTPQLDTTIRQQDLAIAGGVVTVQDGDRFIFEFSGSIDTPANASGVQKTSESGGIGLSFNGSNAVFSPGAPTGVGGAAAHIVLPGVTYQ